MKWKVDGTEYPIIGLASLLGALAGGTASAIGVLLRVPNVVILWLGIAFGLAGFLGLVTLFLADVTLNAKAEGEARRARLAAARRIYLEWASGRLEPPVELKTATLRVNGEVRPLSWLSDDDARTGEWRHLLVSFFQNGRAIQRDSRGERTGLTEADLVGEGRMFLRRDGYLRAVKIAKDLGLVFRENGMATRLAEGWTYTQAITYLQTAAVLPPLRERVPPYQAYTGRSQ